MVWRRTQRGAEGNLGNSLLFVPAADCAEISIRATPSQETDAQTGTTLQVASETVPPYCRHAKGSTSARITVKAKCPTLKAKPKRNWAEGACSSPEAMTPMAA